MPISYMGVGGYKYSVNFGTQKTPILGGHILAFYHSIGVDIILGGGGEGVPPPGGVPILHAFRNRSAITHAFLVILWIVYGVWVDFVWNSIMNILCMWVDYCGWIPGDG